jgi:hypothetical protein
VSTPPTGSSRYSTPTPTAIPAISARTLLRVFRSLRTIATMITSRVLGRRGFHDKARLLAACSRNRRQPLRRRQVARPLALSSDVERTSEWRSSKEKDSYYIAWPSALLGDYVRPNLSRHVHCQAVAPPDEINCGATVCQIVPAADVWSFRGLSGAKATFIVTLTIRSW